MVIAKVIYTSNINNISLLSRILSLHATTMKLINQNTWLHVMNLLVVALHNRNDKNCTCPGSALHANAIELSAARRMQKCSYT